MWHVNKKRISMCGALVALVLCLFLGANYNKDTLLTQYSDATGNQAMFYTIQTKEGLIVIDGGWTANADYVREVIKKEGNKVSAWILTHPHPDHIGAFNAIYANPNRMQIETIYTIDMNYDLYKEYAQEWDDFATYETFVTLTEGTEVHFLYEDDVLEICGLQVEIFSAYKDDIADFSGDLANQGSLVFKVSGEEESILFCSDVHGEEMCQPMVEKYEDRLASTYLQMGHHGNNSITRAFAEAVKPQTAFFDAPEWLVNGVDYDTMQNINMMQELGAECITYQTVPNTVTLR